MSGQWVEHLWEERYNLDITANSESMVTTCTFSLSEQVRNVSMLLSECLVRERNKEVGCWAKQASQVACILEDRKY